MPTLSRERLAGHVARLSDADLDRIIAHPDVAGANAAAVADLADAKRRRRQKQHREAPPAAPALSRELPALSGDALIELTTLADRGGSDDVLHAASLELCDRLGIDADEGGSASLSTTHTPSVTPEEAVAQLRPHIPEGAGVAVEHVYHHWTCPDGSTMPRAGWHVGWRKLSGPNARPLCWSAFRPTLAEALADAIAAAERRNRRRAARDAAKQAGPRLAC